MTRPAIWFFILCLAGYLYPYLIYPLILRILCRLRSSQGRPLEPHGARITHIICAHNEQEHIQRKLANAFESVVDGDLEVILVCDGCTDATCEIARRAAKDRPHLEVIEIAHSGKILAEQAAVARATGDYLVFSDADTLLASDTVRRLIHALGDAACVGAHVCAGPSDSPDRLYMGLEAGLKRLQGCLGNLIGVHGCCYAMRRDAFEKLDSTVISDLTRPLELLLKGKRVGFAPQAVAFEVSERSSFMGSIARRRRIFGGALHTLFRKGYLRRLLRRPALLFHVVSDKLPRYFIGPISALTITVALVQGGGILLATAVLAGAVAIGAASASGRSPYIPPRFAAGARFLAVVNAASLLAICDFLKGKDYAKW
jgi:cellulose synthase/poly-beta-1,6-N-acetylglucosamine synthase-like glycosyltransferase